MRVLEIGLSCDTPLGFALTRPRPRPAGAFRPFKLERCRPLLDIGRRNPIKTGPCYGFPLPGGGPLPAEEPRKSGTSCRNFMQAPGQVAQSLRARQRPAAPAARSRQREGAALPPQARRLVGGLRHRAGAGCRASPTTKPGSGPHTKGPRSTCCCAGAIGCWASNASAPTRRSSRRRSAPRYRISGSSGWPSSTLAPGDTR